MQILFETATADKALQVLLSCTRTANAMPAARWDIHGDCARRVEAGLLETPFSAPTVGIEATNTSTAVKGSTGSREISASVSSQGETRLRGTVDETREGTRSGEITKISVSADHNAPQLRAGHDLLMMLIVMVMHVVPSTPLNLSNSNSSSQAAATSSSGRREPVLEALARLGRRPEKGRSNRSSSSSSSSRSNASLRIQPL